VEPSGSGLADGQDRELDNELSAWPHAVASTSMPGLHFHDLRHAGYQLPERHRDLMARMGVTTASVPRWPPARGPRHRPHVPTIAAGQGMVVVFGSQHRMDVAAY
jgi:hypothetical protein